MSVNVKKLVLVLIISVIGISGCGKKENVYDSVLASMTEDQYYAYVEIGKDEVPVLLISEGRYTYEEGIEAGIMCDVYYAWDGVVQNLGSVNSMGTAYPISYDEEGIYSAGGHMVSKYIINYDTKQLVLAEYAEEIFHENADVTYTYYKQNEEERVVEDDSYLINMFEKFSSATIVNFINE